MHRINLHTHTTFSDGLFEPIALIEAAIDQGLTHIGLSDHYRSLKFLDPRYSLDYDNLKQYIDDIHHLAHQYRSRITVLAGLEINFSLLQTDFTSLHLADGVYSLINELDYILLEYVGDPHWYGLGLEEVLRLRSFIHVPVGLAHNWLSRNFAASYTVERLVATLEEGDIFIELCPTKRNSHKASGLTILRRLLSEIKITEYIPPETQKYLVDKALIEAEALRKMSHLELTTWLNKLSNTGRGATLEGFEELAILIPAQLNQPYYRDTDLYNEALYRLFPGSQVAFSVGTDMHEDLSDVGKISDAESFLHENNLSEHLITYRLS